jgi:hypothetical protein
MIAALFSVACHHLQGRPWSSPESCVGRKVTQLRKIRNKCEKPALRTQLLACNLATSRSRFASCLLFLSRPRSSSSSSISAVFWCYRNLCKHKKLTHICASGWLLELTNTPSFARDVTDVQSRQYLNAASAPGYTCQCTPFDLVNPDMSACIYIWFIREKNLRAITAHTDDGDSEIQWWQRDTMVTARYNQPQERTHIPA